MISSDKILIRYNKFIRTLFFHITYWIACILFYTFITGDQQIFKVYLNLLEVENIYLVVIFLSVCLAILFSFIDILFGDWVMRILPIYFTVFLRFALYTASSLVLILLAARSPLTVYTSENYMDVLKLVTKMDITFLRFLGYFYVAVTFNHLIRGTIQKIGRWNVRNWFLGFIDKPREEERIFMFVDMRSSTTIAEKLGHKKFSHLVQDVFNDLSVVDNYHGEIYQYLGDGAIISWNLKKGIKHNNFINAFYAFINTIQKRQRHYKRKYDFIPVFKAGAHAGKVMVLQVGQIRRDISYNGDTVNTTARIESLCNEYKQNLLISGNLYDLIKNKKEYSFSNVGDIKLKGKRKSVDIYSVKNKSN